MHRAVCWILPGVQKERIGRAATHRDLTPLAVSSVDDPERAALRGWIDAYARRDQPGPRADLSDHDQISKRLERVEKDLEEKKDPCSSWRKTVLEKCKAAQGSRE